MRRSSSRSTSLGDGTLAPLRTGDLLWGSAIVLVVGYLLLRNFAWDIGPFSTLRLGPLELSVFGLLAALDMLFGVYLVHRWCEAFDLDWETLVKGLPWIILLGYYASHLVSVALYFPEDLTNPRALLDPRTRISSFGGILGGGLIALGFLKHKKLPILRYIDVLTLGFVGGYVFGRAGCFAIHDHPGVESDFFMAVDIAGRRRHDLGFYEMLLMLALLVGILFLARKGRPRDGRVFAFAAIVYAPIRFGFDSLRVIDVRYAGLTPGQWFAIPLLTLGLWSAWRSRQARMALIALALLFLPPAASVHAETAPEAFTGHWEGAIALPAGELQVRVDLESNDTGWSGTIDIPAQGATDLPLAGVVVEGNRIRFAIADVPGEPTFDGSLKSGEISGAFTQGGGRLTFRLGREAIAPPARPQLPKPPFPYSEREITYAYGDIRLAATLTIPDGEGPFPGVLLLTGSGPQNRDEELLGHKPFLVLADHLARKGIVVLRADDRGIGGSSGNVVDATTEDFAGDALAGVELLRRRPEVRKDAIGLVGHSEGGLVAPIAASNSETVSFVVLLAAPGVPGSEILPRQTELIARANGVAEGLIRQQVEILKSGLELFSTATSDDELRTGLVSMARRQIEMGGGDTSDSDIEQVLERQIDQMLSPWFRFFVTYDPAPALRHLKIPVLALNGELDLQVDADQNLPKIRQALEASGAEVTLRRLPGLNHLFQSAVTGSPSEYHDIEETFAPVALEAISSWIVERFGG